MARIKYNVKDVDPAGDFATPTPGVYKCKLDVCEEKTSSNDNPMLEVQYVIIEDGEFEGSRIWDYIVLTENQEWKLRRFTDALGLPAAGEMDPERLVGKKVNVQLTNETSEQWGTRARVRNVLKLAGGASDSEDEDEDGEPSEDDLTRDDVLAMKKVELKELIEEEELGIRVTKATKLNTLREKVAEALGLEEAPEEADIEDDAEEVEDYMELEADDLRAECKVRGLPTKGTKKVLAARLDKDDEESGDEPF